MDGGFSAEMISVNDKESIKLIVIGSRDAVARMIHKMHCHQVAEPNDWSRPQRAKNSDEVISLLIQRI